MPTLIHNGELFISVREVMSFMQDFSNDMESKREDCLKDIHNMDLLPEVKKMSITLTNLDYDLFQDSLKQNISHYRDMLIKKRGSKL